MALPDKDRGRPVITRTASKLSITTDEAIVPTTVAEPVRCMRCRHPLTARRSVAVEMGPICRKAVA